MNVKKREVSVVVTGVFSSRRGCFRCKIFFESREFRIFVLIRRLAAKACLDRSSHSRHHMDRYITLSGESQQRGAKVSDKVKDMVNTWKS